MSLPWFEIADGDRRADGTYQLAEGWATGVPVGEMIPIVHVGTVDYGRAVLIARTVSGAAIIRPEET